MIKENCTISFVSLSVDGEQYIHLVPILKYKNTRIRHVQYLPPVRIMAFGIFSNEHHEPIQ